MNGLFDELSGSGAGAEISDDQLYRYTLTRQWSDGPCVAWLCFNPSTADATEDDASIRKMVGFSRRWGYGRMVVLNLFAIRSRDPKAVFRMGDSAVGPLNDYWILQSVRESRELICAWGCAQHAPDINRRIEHVCNMIDARKVRMGPLKRNCLGYRQDNHPRHPLMLKYETQREPFIWRKK